MIYEMMLQKVVSDKGNFYRTASVKKGEGEKSEIVAFGNTRLEAMVNLAEKMFPKGE